MQLDLPPLQRAVALSYKICLCHIIIQFLSYLHLACPSSWQELMIRNGISNLYFFLHRPLILFPNKLLDVKRNDKTTIFHDNIFYTNFSISWCKQIHLFLSRLNPKGRDLIEKWLNWKLIFFFSKYIEARIRKSDKLKW